MFKHRMTTAEEQRALDARMMPPPPPRNMPVKATPIKRRHTYWSLFHAIAHIEHLERHDLDNDDLVVEYLTALFPFRLIHIHPDFGDTNAFAIGKIQNEGQTTYSFNVLHKLTNQTFPCTVDKSGDDLIVGDPFYEKKPRIRN